MRKYRSKRRIITKFAKIEKISARLRPAARGIVVKLGGARNVIMIYVIIIILLEIEIGNGATLRALAVPIMKCTATAKISN